MRIVSGTYVLVYLSKSDEVVDVFLAYEAALEHGNKVAAESGLLPTSDGGEWLGPDGEHMIIYHGNLWEAS